MSGARDPPPPVPNLQLLSDVERAKCEAEWAQIGDDDRTLAYVAMGGGAGARDEPTMTDYRLEAALQEVLISLAEEDQRWRDGADALERRWKNELDALAVRWRAEDAAQLDEQHQQADEVFLKQTNALTQRAAPVLKGWNTLLRATRLDRIGIQRVSQLWARHSSAGDAAAPTVAQTTVLWSLARVRTLFTEAVGAAALGDADAPVDGVGGLCAAICTALHRATREAPSPVGRGEMSQEETAWSDGHDRPEIHRLGVLAFLLMLVDGATALERLGPLVDAISPRFAPSLAGGSGSDGNGKGSSSQVAREGSAASRAPLTYAEQRHLFMELTAACFIATSTASLLASAQCSSKGAAPTADLVARIPAWDKPLTVGEAAAFDQRPDAWAVRPPEANDFAIWCATIEGPTIGTTLSGAKDESASAKPSVARGETPPGARPASTSSVELSTG
jgi:hypothetical protein